MATQSHSKDFRSSETGLFASLAVIGLLLLVWPGSMAHAWPRKSYADNEVAERAEVIVVGALKRDSIQYVPHKSEYGVSGEYHATLVIAEVIKGRLGPKEIPIIIHYGLDLAVGDKSFRNPAADPKQAAKGPIDLANNPGDMWGVYLTGVDQDNLWFLRKRAGIYGEEPGKGDYGVVDPEDVQPLKFKDYFKCYLAKDPEQAVKQYVADHADVADRGGRYLDHQEIQRVIRIDDRKQRAEKLLPFFLDREKWHSHCDACFAMRDGCAEAASPLLLPVFEDPKHQDLREEIIQLWSTVKYAGCVDALVKMIHDHDAFWAQAKFAREWMTNDVRQRNAWLEDIRAIETLGQIGDARAAEVIRAARKRWESLDAGMSKYYLETCDKALHKLAVPPNPASAASGGPATQPGAAGQL